MGRAQQDGNDWTKDSKDILHARSKSDVSRPSSSRDSSVAPQNCTPRKLQRAHTEKVGGNTLAKEVVKTLAIRPTEHTPRSEAAASLNLNVPSIKERGAQHRRGDISPLCDLDHASPFHFEETTAGHQVVPTGDTIEALIDAMFQLEDGDGSCASTPGPLTPCTDSDDAESEKTEEDEEGSIQMVALEEREKRISAGPRWDEEDARRAWEAMKRRVMYIEEHGALPDDSEHDAPTWNYRDAVERALRESRARWRKGWAEEAMRRSQAGQHLGQGRQAREEDEKDANPKREEEDEEDEDEEMGDLTTTMTKKGRRHAGCWIRENDGVFVRLVSSDSFACRKTYSPSHGSSVY